MGERQHESCPVTSYRQFFDKQQYSFFLRSKKKRATLSLAAWLRFQGHTQFVDKQQYSCFLRNQKKSNSFFGRFIEVSRSHTICWQTTIFLFPAKQKKEQLFLWPLHWGFKVTHNLLTNNNIPFSCEAKKKSNSFFGLFIEVSRSHTICWQTTIFLFPAKQKRATLSLAVSLRFQGHTKYEYSKTVFPNRRSAARFRALASIIPGRERFSWNLSF